MCPGKCRFSVTRRALDRTPFYYNMWRNIGQDFLIILIPRSRFPSFLDSIALLDLRAGRPPGGQLSPIQHAKEHRLAVSPPKYGESTSIDAFATEKTSSTMLSRLCSRPQSGEWSEIWGGR